MYRIAIDGACKGNGKPDCISTGAAVCIEYKNDSGGKHTQTGKVLTCYANDYNSTNQRGELKALLQALLFAQMNYDEAHDEFQIITDSEYMFNTITKQWYRSWRNSNWITGGGTPVKNQDLWKRIVEIYEPLEENVVMYHVKGHCLSVGPATAGRLISEDKTCLSLLPFVADKYDQDFSTPKMQERLSHAFDLCERNNGFGPTPDVLKDFVVTNTMADLAASYYLSAIQQ